MANEGKASELIAKIMDVITIVFPAIIAVVGVIGLANATEVVSFLEMAERVLQIGLGAAASIASLIYNWVHKK